jgi:hypothetical protein
VPKARHLAFGAASTFGMQQYATNLKLFVTGLAL